MFLFLTFPLPSLHGQTQSSALNKKEIKQNLPASSWKFNPFVLNIQKVRAEIDQLQEKKLLIVFTLPFFGQADEEPGSLLVFSEADLKPRKLLVLYPYHGENYCEALHYFDADGLLCYVEIYKKRQGKILALKALWFDSFGTQLHEELKNFEKNTNSPISFPDKTTLYRDTKSLSAVLAEY